MTNHAETHGGPAWDSLLDKLFDGALSETESRQLEQQMHANGELRRRVLDLLHMNACLEWEFNRPAELDRLPSASPTTWPAEVALAEPRWWNWQRLRPIVHHTMTVSLILAALTVTIIVLSLAMVDVPAWQDRGETPAAEAFVGNVLGSRDAVWHLDKDAAPPTRLTAGDRLELQSGLIEVELFAGTKAVLEGPLRATVRGDNAVALDFGTATFRVPREAIGFRVDTPSVEVVDLGTEFGMHVELDGATDVCVFNGEVEAVSTADAGGEQRLRLTRGRAIRFETGSAAWSSSTLPSERFVRSMRSTSVLSSVLCEEPMFRLLDSDRDDLGDDLGQAGGVVAIGEWNNDEDPSSNEGRVWMVYRLSEAERHNIEHGHRVTATVGLSQFNGVKLNVSAYGVACEPDHTPHAADYERAGELLAEDIFAHLPRSGGTATFDVTDFAQRIIQQGDSQFAVRLQVDAPQLPNDDQQRDNVLIHSNGPRRPALLIQTPRREYRQRLEKAQSGKPTPIK